MNNLPNTPEDKKAIKEAFQQISEALTEAQTQKATVNDILEALEEKYTLPKKTLRKVAYMFHRQTVTQFETETDEIKELYTAILAS